ncbi:MBL fold metallo-hydrolase [uncultured Eudoraea sp.]|uniref:MBL fold metallo-hydrolase n=1 Tax=uncultured Eudoraea sp. TaxID=1035614 RepID=UPI00262EF39A|nr:MBL fold metallo-hydrolase [uncultured Eudoraea sp.]
MRNVFSILILLVVFTSCKKKPKTEPLVKTAEINEGCSNEGVTLQILGSGGPAAGDRRASTGYLVWLNGSPLVMIDAGGGTYLRLQQAGAHIRDIAFLGISHFHPDHASELPALLWSDIFSNRSAPLNVSGPGGDGSEGLKGYLSAIHDMAAPIDAFTRINTIEVFPQKDSTAVIYKNDMFEVAAIGVNHANKPSLAYKVTMDNKSIVFGADQTLDSPGFIDFVKGADLLVLHLAISEVADKPFTNLHAKPGKVGKVAQESGVQNVVLSHLMKLDSSHVRAREFSLSDLNSNIELVKANFKGTIILAEDLACISL